MNFQVIITPVHQTVLTSQQSHRELFEYRSIYFIPYHNSSAPEFEFRARGINGHGIVSDIPRTWHNNDLYKL